MKKQILVPILTLAVTSLILLGVTLGLNGTAAANAQAEHLQMLRILLPGSTEFVVEPYTGEDETIRSVHKGDNGYVIETVTNGYVDAITMLIGVSNEGTVTGLVVKDMAETMGIGSRALNDHEFLAQFLNTSGKAEVGATVDAISGATVTSKAVTRCVNSAVGYVTGADTSSGATSWGG